MDKERRMSGERDRLLGAIECLGPVAENLTALVDEELWGDLRSSSLAIVQTAVQIHGYASVLLTLSLEGDQWTGRKETE